METLPIALGVVVGLAFMWLATETPPGPLLAILATAAIALRAVVSARAFDEGS